jgi:hypothetical protein
MVDANGYVNTLTAYQIASNTVLQRDGTYTYLNDANGAHGIYLGNNAYNLYYADNHYFSSRSGGTAYAQFLPGGCYNASGTWGTFSDIRTKEAVADYTQGLDVICRLRPVTYQHNGRARMPRDGRTFLGFVADEVADVMPEIVHRITEKLDPEDAEKTELLATEPTAVVYALCNAIRELRDRIAALEGRA